MKDLKWQSNKRIRHKHLVHATNLCVDDILNSIQDGFSIDIVNFLIEAEKSIDLFASFMFSPSKCRTNQLVKINKFE